jgi:hypothetical protein
MRWKDWRDSGQARAKREVSNNRGEQSAMIGANGSETNGDPEWLARASDKVRRMYAYWKSKCEGDKLPPRSVLDPTEIPDLLPYLTLVDVVADERRFVYRLVGTYDVRVRGQDPTGKSVIEAFFGPSLENVLG